MKAKVKRCPFCNSHDLTMDTTTNHYTIHCFYCGSNGPRGYTRNTAIALWNGKHRYTNPDALVANRKSNHHELKEVDL